MKTSKIQLLTACAVAGIAATGAQAQVAFPAAELRGAGASSITTVLVQSLNCVGNPGNQVAGDLVNNRLNKAGNNSNQLSTVAPTKYVPTTPTTTNPVFDCEIQEIQPSFEGKYVATGSGFGRRMWRLFNNQFTGATGSQNPFGTWNNLEFAFSDSPVTQSDLNDYTANANNATNKAGAAIQFPLYVLPVALAYTPLYGNKTTGGGVVPLTFNVKSTYITKGFDGNPNGGLRLSKSAYCKIFNGEITNWNNAALKTLNANQSLKDADDDQARWDSEGVPIRLVGRVDNSGTTDIFTRHLAAACDSQVALNKFDRAAEALPYSNAAGQPDMSGFRTDSPYKPASTSTFSGTTQSISGAFFNRTTQAIVTTQGNEAAGLFLLADGSSGVRDAINLAPDRVSSIDSNVTLNGKFGYIGADFIAPATTLFAAALQQGASTVYVAPSAANATKAFGTGANTLLPPQTTATSGAFNTADTRVNSVTGAAVDRANPLDWTDVLYANPANTLANPNLGYPITGTTQYLGYTCYKALGDRIGTVAFLALNFGKITKTSTNSPISPNTFKGVGPTALGFLPKVGIAPLPAAWQNAINETFLKKSVQASGGTVLGNRNLWIQDKLPLKATDFDGINAGTNKELLSNPTCVAGLGA